MPLIVHRNPDALARGINPFDHGLALHTQLWKTQGLNQALNEHRYDATFDGGRRDEEKSRAMERIFRSAIRSTCGTRRTCGLYIGSCTTA